MLLFYCKIQHVGQFDTRIFDFDKNQVPRLQYAVTGKGDSKPGYTYAKPNYVMIPNQETVDKAIGYLEAMHNNQYISVE